MKQVSEKDFQALADKYGIKFKRTGEFKVAYEVWRFSLIEHSQQLTEVRRELEWMKKELQMMLKSS